MFFILTILFHIYRFFNPDVTKVLDQYIMIPKFMIVLGGGDGGLQIFFLCDFLIVRITCGEVLFMFVRVT